MDPKKVDTGRIIHSCVSIISSGTFTNNSALVCFDDKKKFPALGASCTYSDAGLKLEPIASKDYLTASEYVDEIEMVASLESNSPVNGKYIFELYRFVTKLQIVSNGRPISFRLFRKLYQSRHLDDVEKIFVKYLSSKEQEDGQHEEQEDAN